MSARTTIDGHPPRPMAAAMKPQCQLDSYGAGIELEPLNRSFGS
ncbi:MAG: hypothetical protein NTV94_14170 [Planctomycetota bacterium]|nr:hypothetical protein [Planctomycetota bacterium]